MLRREFFFSRRNDIKTNGSDVKTKRLFSADDGHYRKRMNDKLDGMFCVIGHSGRKGKDGEWALESCSRQSE